MGVVTSLNLPAWLLVCLLKVAFSWGDAKLDVMMVCLQVRKRQHSTRQLLRGGVLQMDCFTTERYYRRVSTPLLQPDARQQAGGHRASAKSATCCVHQHSCLSVSAACASLQTCCWAQWIGAPVECSLAGQQVQLDTHDVHTVLLLRQLIQRLKH